MSSSDQQLSGPDFAIGLEEKELGDGQMLKGHANGEAVLLARRGDEVFAIGATCSHYGGPLDQGLLVGETVRCPLHHACFSLRTGEVEHAPAYNPLPCYDVQRANGRLVVLGKKAPRGVPELASAPTSIVIVGGGAAGQSAAETLRNEGYRGPLTMLTSDDAAPYDRPNLSKDFLAGTASEDWIPLRPDDYFREQNITLERRAEVTKLDPGAKTVTLRSGEVLQYGALLLATGAEPIRLKLPGSELPHVHYLRTLADSRSIIAACKGVRRAVVVGVGFIGLEVAASLRARGIEVEVVGLEKVPLGRVLGDELGAAIQKIHEKHGVKFHLGTSATRVDARAVDLANGETIQADLIVVGIGVHPQTSLAQAAGLTLDRGVAVDATLRTSAPDVYAAGDIARWPDARTGDAIRVEHWVVAQRQGKTAALAMLGKSQPFTAVPFFWSAHYDVTVSYVGHAESWDRIDVAGSIDALDCAVAFRRRDRTLAIATIGRDHVSLEAEAAMERGDEAALHALVPG